MSNFVAKNISGFIRIILMSDFQTNVQNISIEDELKQSYLDYAMSVIVGRALPDARDGLKPVHRRSLFAMHELGNDWNKPYKKSARIVGDVIGKYHPHGDTAVYDTIVRMAQPFSLRYTLVDGQGNFGSIDGDSPAAMRYTEVRMAKITRELLADLDKETVDFSPNYDGNEQIPDVLPTKIPNLLVNGSSGIAVGMATNIPPHNINEIINATLALLDNPNLSFEELIQLVPGPDFPTAATIHGKAGIIDAYRTGKGKIYLRGKYHIEEIGNRSAIIFTEIPYQVNKARVIEKIAELVKDKKIEGIAELRDESNKDGIRIVIEVKRDYEPEILVNNLYAQTQLQNVFGINMVALLNGKPQLLNLQQLLEAFINHRREVVIRRTIYELRKARERAHLLEGLTLALSNIDEVIETIKASSSPQTAKQALLEKHWQGGEVIPMLERAGDISCMPEEYADEYGLNKTSLIYKLTPEQAQAILDLRLHRLTGLEKEKLVEDYAKLIENIIGYDRILTQESVLVNLIKQELEEVKKAFGDERQTQIENAKADISLADLIPEEDMVVTISETGYAKAQPLSDYNAQKRGGRGKSATSMKDEDIIEHLLVTSSHTTILLFSNFGKAYWLKVYEMPMGSRTSKGKPIVNLLSLSEGEKITAILPVDEFSSDKYIFMATAFGTVKKVDLSMFERQRSNGLIALGLDEGDRLVGAEITWGDDQVMLLTSAGKAIRFSETQIRSMGRTARGVRGIRLPEGVEVISLIIPRNKDIDESADLDDDQIQANESNQLETAGTSGATSDTTETRENGEQIYILTASENGYGKRTKLEQFTLRNRGGQGIIAMQTSDRNGAMVGAVQVMAGEDIILISDKGTLVRTRVDEVSISSRKAQGVILIRLQEGEKLVNLVRVVDYEEEETQEEAQAEESQTESQAEKTQTDE